MKRIILTVGVLFFAFGVYYIGQNYTLVQLDSTQLAQVGSETLQSSILGIGPKPETTYQKDVLFRL